MASEDETIIPWVLAGVGTIVSALLTGVVALFRLREVENAKRETENAKVLDEHKTKIAHLELKSDKCEEDRSKLFAQCEVNTFEIKSLKERISLIDANGTKVWWDDSVDKVTTTSTNNALFGFIVSGGGAGANTTVKALHQPAHLRSHGATLPISPALCMSLDANIT